MNKVQSSSTFLFWFLLECLLHVCWLNADDVPPAEKTAGSPGSRQLQTTKTPMEQPRDALKIFRGTAGTSGPATRPTLKILESWTKKGTSQNTDTPETTEAASEFVALSAVPRSNSWNEAIIPRRPGLVQVISVSSISFVIALFCGLMISYMIYRLVKAEEKQQLAMLYENLEIPLLDEKEASEDEGQDESSEPHPENEELGKFIGSVIRTKRRESILKKKKGEQNLLNENMSEDYNYTEKAESQDEMEKDEKGGYL
ncbi:uncharacterized protein C19orf18 homolog isoform X2 [Mesocricetus auratus]|uniref:Uncharacterized protein C19orf18 homolog isoform X2 n=1 Tax=Mesocricetus auratus TaxID=10036 RepID=A0ABM2WH79_MESAU|nr:uncharacterized protein C19orf18 homolog isoform X2 [Mesocricetus auratus]